MSIFNKTKTLTLAALFVAIAVVLSFFKVPLTLSLIHISEPTRH